MEYQSCKVMSKIVFIYQHINVLKFTLFVIQISFICSAPQIFTKVGGENIKIEGIYAFYSRSVSSLMECSLVCQRHKCVFAQIVPQEIQPGFNCSLFGNIEDISIVLVYHKGAQIVKLDKQHTCSNDQDSNPLTTLITSLPECLDWYHKGYTVDGLYHITINGKSTQTYCVMQNQQTFGAGVFFFRFLLICFASSLGPVLDQKIKRYLT